MAVTSRTAFVMVATLLTLIPMPTAAASDPCIFTRLDFVSGLRIVADAETDIVVLGVGLPDPGSGRYAGVEIHPRACTSASTANLIGIASSTAMSSGDRLSFPALP